MMTPRLSFSAVGLPIERVTSWRSRKADVNIDKEGSESREPRHYSPFVWCCREGRLQLNPLAGQWGNHVILHCATLIFYIPVFTYINMFLAIELYYASLPSIVHTITQPFIEIINLFLAQWL